MDKKQVEALLQEKLDASTIKQRSQSGRTFSYIEGWHAIAEANRIFGHLTWHRNTIYCRHVSEEKNQNGNHVIGYIAKVRITVRLDDGSLVIREGTGFGNGIARQLFEAHESASKEAETDAMKRALMTFGNPFGLALYDKAQAGVEHDAPIKVNIAQVDPKLPDRGWYDKTLAAIDTAGSIEDLKQLWTMAAPFVKLMKANPEAVGSAKILEGAKNARKKFITSLAADEAEMDDRYVSTMRAG